MISSSAKKQTILFVFASVLLFLVWVPVRAQIRLVHTPILFAQADHDIEIRVRVDGMISPNDELRVYYRPVGVESYDYVVLENRGQEFVGAIPAQSIDVQSIEYFVSFIHERAIFTYPEENPYYQPLRVQITPARSTKKQIQNVAPKTKAEALIPLPDEKFLIISPEDGETISADELVIAVSLFFDIDEIDVPKTRLYIDGKKVSPELSENLITYVPPRISEGEHEISLHFVRQDGKEYQPLRWRFSAMATRRGGFKAMPLLAGASGNIYVESKMEKYSGNRLDNHQVGGQLKAGKGFLSLGTRFYVTSLEDRNYQPRNRFLFWLDAKILQLYVGDTSPYFSEIMLWGKRVRGLNAKLNLKFINLNVVMGQTYRPVEGVSLPQRIIDPITQDTLYYDPATGDTLRTSVRRFGTYRQNLLGIRTTFGPERGSHWGISLLKVKDDVNSIRTGLRPKDNLVLGTDLQFSFFRNRFNWRTDAAFSILTDDISPGVLSKSEIDSLLDEDIPIDPADFEKYIILNTSTVPIDPTKLSSLAVTSLLRLRLLRNDLTVKYKSIGSAYNSLGNTFLRKNIRGFYFNDRIRLWQNRIYFNVSFENYQDNFSQNDNNPVLDLQTWQYGFNFYPGLGLPNLNIHYRSYSRNDHVDLGENNRTNEITTNVNYDFQLFNLNHTLNVNYIKLDKTDAFADQRPTTILPIGIANDIQTIALTTRYAIPLRTTISYTSNKNSYLGGANLFKFNNLDIRWEYRMLQERLSVYGGIRSFSASGGTNPSAPGAQNLTNITIDYSKFEIDFGGRFRISSRQFLVFDLSTIKFTDRGGYINPLTGTFVSNPSFNDYSIRFRYEMQL